MTMYAWMVRTATLVVLAPVLGAQTAPVQRGTSCSPQIQYVELNGRDTVGVSWNRLTDSTFDSRVRAVSQGAYIHFSGTRDSAGAVGRVHIEIWQTVADTAGPPTQIADLVVRDREVLATVAAPARGMQVRRDSILPGTLLFMDNEPIFLELIQRQVHPPLNDSVRVRWLWLFTGGFSEEITVRRTASDLVTIDSPQVQVLLRIARDGSIADATSKPRLESGKTITMTRSGCQ